MNQYHDQYSSVSILESFLKLPLTHETLWVLHTYFTIPVFKVSTENGSVPKLPYFFCYFLPMALERERLTAFIVIIEENSEVGSL